MLTKFFNSELLTCLPKVDHVIKSCKEPIKVPADRNWCADLSQSSWSLALISDESFESFLLPQKRLNQKEKTKRSNRMKFGPLGASLGTFSHSSR